MSYPQIDRWGWTIWWVINIDNIGKIHRLTTKIYSEWNFESPNSSAKIKDDEIKYFKI